MKAGNWIITALVGAVAILVTMLVSDIVNPGGRYVLAQDSAAVPYLIGITGPEQNLRLPLFLIDIRKEVILSYEYNISRRSLELVRVRTYRYDRQLEDYENTASRGGPSVGEVRQMVRRRAGGS